jgi:hypothetical protein
MVEGGPPEFISIQCRDAPSGRPAPAGGETPSLAAAQIFRASPEGRRSDRYVGVRGLCRARGRPARSGGGTPPARGVWRTEGAVPPAVPGVGGARGRERAGPTRSHPEPGRDPAQRRRVLWGRPHGRRGRRGHPPPSARRRPDGQEEERPRAENQQPGAGWSSGSSLGS